MKEQSQFIRTARFAGFWYLLLAVSGVLGFMLYHPKIFVDGDAQATLNHLVSQTFDARIRLILELVIIGSQALAAVWFYHLFCDINKRTAFSLAVWGTVNAVIITVSAISINGSIDVALSSHFTNQEKLILIGLLSKVISISWNIGGIFFGLWLIPMGTIIVQSKRMPIWLGRILIMGGVGYLLQTLLICMGIQNSNINLLTMPSVIGELWMVSYLLIYGIRPQWEN